MHSSNATTAALPSLPRWLVPTLSLGAGLTYTLLQDPRMAPIAQWPMALIPLFGVGLSGTAHLIAFDLLRKRQIV